MTIISNEQIAACSKHWLITNSCIYSIFSSGINLNYMRRIYIEQPCFCISLGTLAIPDLSSEPANYLTCRCLNDSQCICFIVTLIMKSRGFK
ncbi:hypothetical protein FGO68_gene15876 [Halteria grandinella]|uniref:Uncharacterized protein n=1 Tax=Halteria grandinella TaxID=5974 RepID=A0A8J8NZW2_HALGN|nr:hypothetical protein FGO68_gene15876 [Halteria grandinella]